MRSIVDADGVPWTADEDEVLGGRPTYQIAVVFTAPDGRRRWAPIERGKLAKLTEKELLALLLTAGGTQATRG
jgi:hypothetical protein